MRDDIWNDFNSLPPEAQQVVADLIAFLRRQTRPSTARKRAPREWENEPFVGMWRDREDMEDSSAWVRQLREREWTRSRG
jgi:hypothetical protein